jgi:hypothetical protein
VGRVKWKGWRNIRRERAEEEDGREAGAGRERREGVQAESQRRGELNEREAHAFSAGRRGRNYLDMEAHTFLNCMGFYTVEEKWHEKWQWRNGMKNRKGTGQTFENSFSLSVLATRPHSSPGKSLNRKFICHSKGIGFHIAPTGVHIKTGAEWRNRGGRKIEGRETEVTVPVGVVSSD